jgi:hypothetical protein
MRFGMRVRLRIPTRLAAYDRHFTIEYSNRLDIM